MFIKTNKKLYDLTKRTHIMGILNVTPDSFSDGGLYSTKEKALEEALKWKLMELILLMLEESQHDQAMTKYQKKKKLNALSLLLKSFLKFYRFQFQLIHINQKLLV